MIFRVIIIIKELHVIIPEIDVRLDLLGGISYQRLNVAGCGALDKVGRYDGKIEL